MARPEAEIRSEPQRGQHETAKIDPEEMFLMFVRNIL